jgi:AcrR family transcriptional regulator
MWKHPTNYNYGLMDNEPLILLEERPTRADAVKNRDLLLRTAAELFQIHDANVVTMSTIAQAAGVGKGTLYRHFASKTDLCHALLDEDQRDLQNRTLLRLRNQHPPLDDLRWYLEQVVDFVIKHLPLLSVMGEASGGQTSLANQAHIWWRQTIRGLLGRAGISGDLDYQADTLYVLTDPQTIRFQMTLYHYDQARIVAGVLYVMEQLTR